MKVICKCETEVEMTVVGGQYQYTYEGTCPKCKLIWQLTDIIAECDEEVEIGEHGFDDLCDKCKKCGETTCGNDTLNHSCFKEIVE